MPIVDSHCHVSPVWYEPVESLLFQMDGNGVEQAVLVQMMGQRDNRYQFDCVRRFPGRFAPIVIVDTDRPDAPDILTQLAEEGAAGVRLQAGTRSAGEGPPAIWRAAARLRLPVSCAGSAEDFAADAFAELVKALPELSVVLEHLGGVGRPRGPATPPTIVARVFALARFPNVTMKVTGLGEFSSRAMPVTEPSPFVEDAPPFLDMALRAFGAGRLMWGSDYPPVSTREGYANALRRPREHYGDLPAADRDAIFGGTARSVFPVRR